MTILYFLIPLALLLMAGALWALFWAIRTGQFDDLETQGWSVVLDEDHEVVVPQAMVQANTVAAEKVPAVGGTPE
jgi:cbb3-type cytochrome oxidase maturation protein